MKKTITPQHTFSEFTGKEYLKLDIASNFGLEKKTWYERLCWFDENESQLESLVQQAEVPALYYAGVKAWRDTEAGKPTGYMISLDATSSGLQLLACLTGDLSAAQLCNVVPTGYREDAYTNITAGIQKLAGNSVTITRDQAKDAIMTSLYGSTAMPKAVFGEGKLLDHFFEAMRTLAPAAWELNQGFLKIWDPTATEYSWILPDNFHVHSKVMDNVKSQVSFRGNVYDVFTKENVPVKQGRSLGANVVHSLDGMIVRELTRRCSYDPAQVDKVLDAIENPTNRPLLQGDAMVEKAKMVLTLWQNYQKSGYLSARILDYIDAETVNLVDRAPMLNLIGSLPDRPFPVVSIHDCFRVHPNYGNDLRRQYNLQLTLIARSNILAFILKQLTGRDVTINKAHPGMASMIENTDYALS